MLIEFSAALCLAIVVGLSALLLSSRKQLCKTRRACAVADTVPLARFCWATGERDAGKFGNIAPYRDFVAGLTSENAARLETSRLDLLSLGTPFSLTFATRDGCAYTIDGRRAVTGESVLWVADASVAESARRAQQEAAQLREMLDVVPLPIWRHDADLALADCNRAFARALDTTREVALLDGRELACGVRDGERRHIVISGSRRLLEFSEVPCAGGGSIGFALDRTDVETAEGELWRHINAHAEVLEGIRASVAIYGPDKRLKFFNSAFASMWGIAEGWLAVQPSFEEVMERLRELRRLPEVADFRAFKCERLRMFNSLIEPQQEFMHLPDGRTLLLSISPHPFGGLTFVYEDVTDRLALERSCNTLTQVRRATLDHLFEGIAVYGSDGRLKLYNPAYLAVWGLSEGEVAGEPHIGSILERTRALIDDGGDWATTKQRIIDKVTAHVLASGPLYRTDGSMLQEAAVPLPDGNVLLTYLDVTDTARVERALRERNEALETAGRLKSEFIANVSHELRTPLNAVIGFADILNNRYFGDLNSRQLEYTRGILASSHRLLKLINDILDLATIEAGYMVLETGRVEVREMLQTVFSLTRDRAASRNLSLELQCPPEIGAIAADERRLKQALFNLISNAIKFTPPGGAVTIGAERREAELLLIVADTGIGIPRADQARMLEKFEHGPRQSGAGLGLSLVKSLIELHGGTIGIESTVGRGTRIVCRLPIARRNLLSAALWPRETALPIENSTLGTFGNPSPQRGAPAGVSTGAAA
jgi:signal transduction histidine kinase